MIEELSWHKNIHQFKHLMPNPINSFEDLTDLMWRMSDIELNSLYNTVMK